MKLKRCFCQRICFLSLFLLCVSSVGSQNRKIDLSGEWHFQMDTADVGVQEHWFSAELNDTIALPGSMPENYKGDEVTLHTQWTASIYDSSFFFNPRLEKYRTPHNLKLPFLLTPVKYYVGAAWYQRNVVIPRDWKGGHVKLFLERPHTESHVWINGRDAGVCNSLSVPHVFDITPFLKEGTNTLSICIDNRIKEVNVGKDSHSITDQTQGNWNGVVGRMELHYLPATFIDDVQIFPNIKEHKARVRISIVGKDKGRIALSAKSFNGSIGDAVDEVHPVSKSFLCKGDTTLVEMDLEFGEHVKLWNEFHPNLYRLKVELFANKYKDERSVEFGMREFSIKDTYFYVNGQKTMLRGTVENCVFPLTGYAPMDVDSWVRIFHICKDFGLNHMRFHSYCPPEAAMKAADLVGMYLQPEGPSWPNHGSSLGDGRPVDNYLMLESKRIMKQYGNYPSFCMFAIGNEPRGKWVPWVSHFVDYWKQTDTRRVYTGASVGGSWAWQPKSQYHVKAGARGLNWSSRPETSSDFLSKIDTVKEPYVSHETGQWCVFPDFSEIESYTGVMRARNLELFQQDLKDRNMDDMASNFLKASGHLQAMCYKNEIEKILRTPKYAGFQLLSLNDYSGQGTALVGVLNAFWKEKGYIDAEQFSQFCAPTVLLARMDKLVYLNNETLEARIEVANFGEHSFLKQKTAWKIKNEWGTVVAKGELGVKDIEIGNGQFLGKVVLPLSFIKKASKLNLEVAFSGTNIKNNWDLWVYPAELPEQDSSNIYITDSVNPHMQDVLRKGGKVLLLLAGKVEQGKDVIQYMTPAFWNTSWFKMRPPHTVGTFINNSHPLFKDFPTDAYTGLQWWELIYKAQVMELTDFPPHFQPIVQPIDTWFINRKLGMLFEANVGGGKLIVCSADLRTDLENRPVAKQLLYSIVNYMNSNHFVPQNNIPFTLISNLTLKSGERLQINTTDAPDELKNKTQK